MMLHFAPDAVECALLYDSDRADIDFDDLLGFLNAAFMAPGQRFERATMPELPHFRMFVGHGLHILISTNHQPLAAEGFAGSLRSAYTSLLVDDASVRVAHHKSNIFVTVSTNAPLPDHPLLEEIGYKDAPRWQTSGDFETKLTLCRVLAGYIARQRNPSIVHWCQSNTLISTDGFIDAAAEKDATWLYLHPAFYSPGIDSEGRQILGAKMHVAAQLVNHTLTFKPAPVPPIYIVERMANFIDMVRARDGEPLPDGDSFGADSTELIRVRHTKKPDDLPGEIELTLERHEEIGLLPAPPSRSVDERSTGAWLVNPPDSPAKNSELAATAPAASAPAQNASAEVRAVRTEVPTEALPAASAHTPTADSIAAAETLSVVSMVEPKVEKVNSNHIWSSADPVVESTVAGRQKITRANAPKARAPEERPSKSLFSRLRSIGR